MSMNQGQQGWTGTQNMEGQSGMGPSSLGQGARWGGEPSWMGGMAGQQMGQQFSQQFGGQQANLPSWARGTIGAPQQAGTGTQGWTGTQYGEGHSGFGPSSLSQGARWGGDPSWIPAPIWQYQPSYQQTNQPGWARGGIGVQGNFGQQGGTGSQGWTGTQYGEGQSGFGPSSLSQGVRWGGEPSWSSGFGAQYQGAPQALNLPSWTRGGFGGQEGGVGGQQGGFGQQTNISGQSGHTWRSTFQAGTSGWTGTQPGEGQSGFGPSSLGGATAGNLQSAQAREFQGPQNLSQGSQVAQGNWQTSR